MRSETIDVSDLSSYSFYCPVINPTGLVSLLAAMAGLAAVIYL